MQRQSGTSTRRFLPASISSHTVWLGVFDDARIPRGPEFLVPWTFGGFLGRWLLVNGYWSMATGREIRGECKSGPLLAAVDGQGHSAQDFSASVLV